TDGSGQAAAEPRRTGGSRQAAARSSSVTRLVPRFRVAAAISAAISAHSRRKSAWPRKKIPDFLAQKCLSF
ncbi:MAG: hypothetical protein K2K64_01460, partial [Muribaculaceae bacterium]|nr:hypothetical protein [Muribaculaceae bacterium]